MVTHKNARCTRECVFNGNVILFYGEKLGGIQGLLQVADTAIFKRLLYHHHSNYSLVELKVPNHCDAAVLMGVPVPHAAGPCLHGQGDSA